MTPSTSRKGSVTSPDLSGPIALANCGARSSADLKDPSAPLFANDGRDESPYFLTSSVKGCPARAAATISYAFASISEKDRPSTLR